MQLMQLTIHDINLATKKKTIHDINLLNNSNRIQFLTQQKIIETKNEIFHNKIKLYSQIIRLINSNTTNRYSIYCCM